MGGLNIAHARSGGSSPPSGLYRNPYISGDKVITQRGDFTTPAAILDDVYGVDRFKSLVTGVTATFQHVSANQPSLLSGSWSTKYVATSTASGTLGEIQKVEDKNYLKLVGKNLIQGVWVKSNSPDARVLVWDGSTFTSSVAHSGGGAWELLSVGAPPVTDLQLYVVIASVSGASVSISSGDYIEMTGNTGNEGTTLLPFQPREYDKELASCLRYYEKWTGHLFTTFTFAEGISTVAAYGMAYFQPKRTTPTFGFGGAIRLFDGANHTITNITLSNMMDPNPTIGLLTCIGTGFTRGLGGFLGANNDIDAYMEFKAEL